MSNVTELLAKETRKATELSAKLMAVFDEEKPTREIRCVAAMQCAVLAALQCDYDNADDFGTMAKEHFVDTKARVLELLKRAVWNAPG